MTRFLLLILPKLPRVPGWLIQRGLAYVAQGRVYFHEVKANCETERDYSLKNGWPALMLETHDPLPVIVEGSQNVYQEYLKQRAELNKLAVWLRATQWVNPAGTTVDIAIYHLTRLAAVETAAQGRKREAQ